MNIIYTLIGSTIILIGIFRNYSNFILPLMNESDILAAGKKNPKYWHSNVISHPHQHSKNMIDIPNSWMDSNGGHIRSVGNLGLNQCRRQCQETPVCRSYCYDPERRWCYLRRQPNKLSKSYGSPPSEALVSRHTTCGIKI